MGSYTASRSTASMRRGADVQTPRALQRVSTSSAGRSSRRTGLDAAYRDYTRPPSPVRTFPHHLMDFTYYVAERCRGGVRRRLRRPWKRGENTLPWIPLNRDFFDSRR